MKLKTFQRKTARTSVEGEQRPALNQPRPFAQPAAPEQHAPSASLRARDGQAAGEGHHFGRVATSPRESARGRAVGGSLPDRIRAGVEKLSGVSLADVRVHYDSPRPARMGARAYTQGAEIHVAPGEERHLAHEAWHVVQQKRGRVRANARLGAAGLNASPILEKEADVMGARALRASPGGPARTGHAHPGRTRAATPSAAPRTASAAPIQAKQIWPGFGNEDDPEFPLRHLFPQQEQQGQHPQHNVPQQIMPAQNNLPQNDQPQIIPPQIDPPQNDPPLVGVPKVGNAPRNDQMLDAPPQQITPPLFGVPKVGNVPRNDQMLNALPQLDLSQQHIAPRLGGVPKVGNAPRNDQMLDAPPQQITPPLFGVPKVGNVPQLHLSHLNQPQVNRQQNDISSISGSNPKQPPNERTRLVQDNPGYGVFPINNGPQRQQQQPGLWQRIKNWFSTPSKGEQFLAANSPGIYTGPGGGGLAAASNAMAFGQSLQQNWSANSINNPSSTVNTLGQAGSTISGVGDLAAIARSAHTIHNARKKLDSKHRPKRELARSQIKSGAIDIATQSVDTGSQTANLVSSFAQHGSAVATHAGQVAPFLSVPVSAVVGARAAWRSGRALMHEDNLKALDKSQMTDGMRDAAEFSQGQMRKRKRRNFIGAAGAALGVGGGLALGLGALGVGAAMATPVGWGLAAAAGGIALGVGAYKLGRWAWKKYKGQGDDKLGAARERHAEALHAAIDPTHPNHNPANLPHAQQILNARGIKEQDVRGKGGKDFLKRKLESW